MTGHKSADEQSTRDNQYGDSFKEGVIGKVRGYTMASMPLQQYIVDLLQNSRSESSGCSQWICPRIQYKPQTQEPTRNQSGTLQEPPD
jgi:hypothetical protein